MQETLLELEIQGLPPTVNQIYRTGSGRSFRYKTRETLNWQQQVTALMAAERKFRGYSGPARLYITLQSPNRKRWDLDNRVKALQDCLQMAEIIKDDSQIWELQVKRKLGEKTMTRIVLERGELPIASERVE